MLGVSSALFVLKASETIEQIYVKLKLEFLAEDGWGYPESIWEAS